MDPWNWEGKQTRGNPVAVTGRGRNSPDTKKDQTKQTNCRQRQPAHEQCVNHNSRRKNKTTDPELTAPSSPPLLPGKVHPSRIPDLKGSWPELPRFILCLGAVGGTGSSLGSRARALQADKCAGSRRAELPAGCPTWLGCSFLVN